MSTILERDASARKVTPHDLIEFLLAEHLNHRRMCKALERLAATQSFEAAVVTSLLEFIRNDLTVHVLDEEEDIFPLLKQRCEADDKVEEVLSRLTIEHGVDRALSAQVQDVLRACLILRKAPSAIEGGADALRAFAQNELRHLALENAVVVPLARRRFSEEDLAFLSKRLLTRRALRKVQ